MTKRRPVTKPRERVTRPGSAPLPDFQHGLDVGARRAGTVTVPSGATDRRCATRATCCLTPDASTTASGRARMRLQRVVAAIALSDLRLPPSHRLKALSGDRKGQNSIRINDQWRVYFYWTEQGAMEIEITDYH